MSPVDVVEDQLRGLDVVLAVREGVSEAVPGDHGGGVALAQARQGHGVALASHQQSIGGLFSDLGRSWKNKLRMNKLYKLSIGSWKSQHKSSIPGTLIVAFFSFFQRIMDCSGPMSEVHGKMFSALSTLGWFRFNRTES